MVEFLAGVKEILHLAKCTYVMSLPEKYIYRNAVGYSLFSQVAVAPEVMVTVLKLQCALTEHYMYLMKGVVRENGEE